MEQIYLYFLILIIPFFAQLFITFTYNKNKNKQNKKGISGFEVARSILDSHGLESMYIVEVKGSLTDHYDAKQKVIRLSTEVFHGESIAAIAIAAHECCHAIQDKEGYNWFKIRTLLCPIFNLLTYFAYFFFVISLFLQIVDVLLLSIGFMFFGLLFQLFTLPAELDASKRAMNEIEKNFFYEKEEIDGGRETLKAAACTYVASIISSLFNLIRLLRIDEDRRR